MTSRTETAKRNTTERNVGLDTQHHNVTDSETLETEMIHQHDELTRDDNATYDDKVTSQ